ncbi:MAG: FtsQ-type POTRA domain-containing protein [Tissierellia bacterium]|nr:FtsQ-type POTRA domain-containing protein [Tissierellia bacterium]
MKKSKSYKRKARKRILKLFLFILILTLLYLFIFKTSFFNIKNIKVMGNHKMDYDKIVKASMCIQGENIFKINKRLGEESLNRLPYIKQSKIKRKLPKEIVIEIEEREEIAIIPYIGSFVYIDEEGYILSIEEKGGKVKLPQIFGLDLIDLEVGENLFKQLEDDNVVDFILLSKQAKLLSLMKYINFSDSNNTMIELNNGVKVAFGTIDNVKYKLSFLFNILEDVEKRNINVKQILLNKGSNPIIVTDDK